MISICFNINSIRARPHQLIHIRDNLDPDVIGLQETKVNDPDFHNDLISGSLSYSKISGNHFLLPYVFYSRSNERLTADLNTKGFGFNNTYNIDTNNSISYSSSLSFTDYNRTSSKDAEIANDKNNNTFTTSVGYNHAFSC